MMESIENKGITVTIALKNEVAGKTKPLFGLAKTSHTAETLAVMAQRHTASIGQQVKFDNFLHNDPTF
ncbi:MAG: hypothetical protein LBS16_02090 [Prevotellaceae bacterium]|jgi:hypothetical protein|nr:hypothetical protein [Prevotellaceae bacterium]